jgi:DNA (cytosine-5)-methyltransferase 1
MPQVTGKRLAVRQPVAVGSYIYAGGFTLGVREYFNVLCHLEDGVYGVKTVRQNLPGLPVHTDLASWPLEELASSGVDLVYGNPPCAPWSAAGYTKTRGTDKWKTDPRVGCAEKHFSLLMALRPRVWVWESVTQAFTRGREFCDGLAAQAAALGYSTTYLLHDAMWFGLPQSRKRFFMVCHTVDFSPEVPRWVGPPTPLEVLPEAVIGEPCIGRAGPMEIRRHSGILKHLRPGERLIHCWERLNPPGGRQRHPDGRVVGRPSYGHYRLPLSGPGGAVVGYGIVHPVEDRWLSTEEMQLLSGFPPWYTFTPGGASARAGEIARGVCPPVGAWLARSVLRSLAGAREVTSPRTVLTDLRKPPGQVGCPLPAGHEVTGPAQVAAAVTTTGPRVRKASSTVAVRQTRKGPVAPPQGIGRYIRQLLRAGNHTPEEIVTMTRAAFPQSRATVADVAWNRGKLARGALRQ